MAETKPSLSLPWTDVRAALDVLRECAAGHFHPQPIGNRVVISFDNEADLQIILERFGQSRRTEDKHAVG